LLLLEEDRMTTYVPAKKGAEYIFYISLVSQSTGQFQSSAAIAAGDFKVSKDGGALANLTTLPAVTPAASKAVKVTLSSTEMNADNIVVIGSDAAGAEWDDVFINIQTSVNQIDDLSARLPAALSGDGFMKADLKSIDDETTDGNNASLFLKKIDILNEDAGGIAFRAIGADVGIKAQGGSAGVQGTSVSGISLYLEGNNGIRIDANQHGVIVVGGESGDNNYHALQLLTDSPSGGNSISAPDDIAVSDGDLTLAAITDAVWDEPTAGHTTAGTTGKALTDAGSAGDPWGTTLPGAYGAGTAGKIIGDNINATISSRATQTSVDDIPTNAELATALGTADDAVLAQVALVKTETDKIASIKTKTDQLAFGVTNTVNANITHVIADAVQENGADNTEWGGTP
jgi:hypothetical protein